MQQIQLSVHEIGWSKKIWDILRQASAGRHNTEATDYVLQSQAAAALAGLDVRKVKSFPLPGTGLAFDPSGSHLMISGSSLVMQGPERPVQVWDSRADQLQATQIKGEGVCGFRPDGTPLFFTVPKSESSKVHLWDAARAQVLRTFVSPVQGNSIIKASAMTPDGSTVVAFAVALDEKGKPAERGMIAVWEAASGPGILPDHPVIGDRCGSGPGCQPARSRARGRGDHRLVPAQGSAVRDPEGRPEQDQLPCIWTRPGASRGS